MSKQLPKSRRATQQRNVLKTTTGSRTTKENTQLRNSSCGSLKSTNHDFETNSKLKTITSGIVSSFSQITGNRSIVAKPQNIFPSKATTVIPRGVQKTKPNRNITFTTKPIDTRSRKKDISAQPIRAQHKVNVSEETTRNSATVAKTNAVLDTYHNVTISSPPPRRKERTSEATSGNIVQYESNEHPKRIRTHSLEEEEVIILRTDSAKCRIEQQILTNGIFATSANVHETNIFNLDANERAVIKEPITFDVKFQDPLKRKLKSNSRELLAARNIQDITLTISQDECNNYSDDFESYESDFESDFSAQNDTENTIFPNIFVSESFKQEENIKRTTYSSSEKEEFKGIGELSVDEDDSELTQNPVKVIQRDSKIEEEETDSGNYERNSQIYTRLSEISSQIRERNFDSMDTAYNIAISEQFDSGISSYANLHMESQSETEQVVRRASCTYSGYTAFHTHPVLNKRGTDLMKKIKFDCLKFSIFELKPISYEVYMQNFGVLNMTQVSVQTNGNHKASETQTDKYEMRTMWTQHPPQYDQQTIKRLQVGVYGTAIVQSACGETPMKEIISDDIQIADVNLKQLDTFRRSSNNRFVCQQRKRLSKQVDFEKLNSFMTRASHPMSRVLNSHSKQKAHLFKPRPNKRGVHDISKGCIQLEANLLSALHVKRVFSNALHDLIITVHASTSDSDVYRSDFSNLLIVWSSSDGSKPLRLLSTWSEISHVEICDDCAHIVVCGLHDGSIAMWDLRETYSFCSKLDGYLTHFPATQSILPMWNRGSTTLSHRVMELGAVIDIRSFRVASRPISVGTYKPIQFAALSDTGFLSIWTLIKTSGKKYELDTVKGQNSDGQIRYNSASMSSYRFGSSSPWARFKLIQSTSCNLQEYLERGLWRAQTQFERTKLIFEKEIYNDNALHELNNAKSTLQHQKQQLKGLRFTGIDTGCERIYVCTNRNFILICSKTLKSERFCKINISEDFLLFPTVVRLLTNDTLLAVGLSNGSVIIVNCNQQKLSQQRKKYDRCLETAKFSSRSVTSMRHTNGFDPDTGKSCAIQNIILNERRLLAINTFADYDTQPRPSTAACTSLTYNQICPFEIHVYDREPILTGSALRKDLVQSLELSSDGWRLFALVNGHIRVYDFYLEREICEDVIFDKTEKRVMDIAASKSFQNESQLIILEEGNQVHVLSLMQ